MGVWRTIDSPRLRIPMELREVTPPGGGLRTWEVQELRNGSMFKVVLPPRSPQAPATTPTLPDAAMEHAVCLAVEDALLAPPKKEPGETYDVTIAPQNLEGAKQLV